MVSGNSMLNCTPEF